MDEEILEYCHWLFPEGPAKGSFEFKVGDSLKENNNVPNKFGIYLIFAKKKVRAEKLVYIGKAGSVNTDGKRSKQGLRDIINNVQIGDISKEEQLIEKIRVLGLEKIIIYWFLTYTQHRQLPGFVESELIEIDYKRKHKLPDWNSRF